MSRDVGYQDWLPSLYAHPTLLIWSLSRTTWSVSPKDRVQFREEGRRMSQLSSVSPVDHSRELTVPGRVWDWREALGVNRKMLIGSPLYPHGWKLCHHEEHLSVKELGFSVFTATYCSSNHVTSFCLHFPTWKMRRWKQQQNQWEVKTRWPLISFPALEACDPSTFPIDLCMLSTRLHKELRTNLYKHQTFEERWKNLGLFIFG